VKFTTPFDESTLKRESKLLPDRHPQSELFICDISDAVIKDDMASMEHPIFSLSTRPDREPRTYQKGNVSLEVKPSTLGVATIHDKDVLIFAISQIMAAKNAGLPYSRHVSFSAYDFLIFSNRQTGGSSYDRLKDTLERLDGTRLRTTIKTGGEETWQAFGLIDGATIRKKNNDGRVVEWGVTLSEWLFRAIEAQEVLTLNPEYFRLRRPLERRVYEIARKHCGRQSMWKIDIANLHKKCGSRSPLKQFKYLVGQLVEFDHLPDYSVCFEGDNVVFRSRGSIAPKLIESVARVRSLDADIYHDARSFAPGWDIHYLEQEWRRWMEDGGAEPPRNPEKAFLGFCKKWYERRGAPK
jgi:hypothetical protein